MHFYGVVRGLFTKLFYSGFSFEMHLFPTGTTVAKLYIINVCGKINLIFNFLGLVCSLILLIMFFIQKFNILNKWRLFCVFYLCVVY